MRTHHRVIAAALLAATTAVTAACSGTSQKPDTQPTSTAPSPGSPTVSTPDPGTSSSGPTTGLSQDGPRIRHVFVINIENKGFGTTWRTSYAPYLSHTLRRKGVLLTRYYGTAHYSQPNYVAQISGQGPNPSMQGDCTTYSTFHRTGKTVFPGQAKGYGCVFPRSVPSLPVQMSRHHLTWKAYMDDMKRPCQHPALNGADGTVHATAKSMYATRHNPFVYFRAIIDSPSCRRDVVPLPGLRHDLRSAATTPNLAYITPDLCHDGHDAPCANGAPGSLTSVNRWMHHWVPLILRSPAFRHDGMLVITADESDSPASDSSACCGERHAPNAAHPGVEGPGGGRIGALVISRLTRPDTTSSHPYNHYSLLASIEKVFGLHPLGYARTAHPFGTDVYSRRH